MTAVVFLLLMAAAPAIVQVQAEAQDDGFSLLYTVTWEGAEGSRPFEAFDTVGIAVVDLNNDGTREILAHNDNNNLYVFDGATGRQIAKLETNHPEDWNARELAGVGVGDVSGNGLFDIVVSNSAGWVTVFEAIPLPEGHEKIVFVKLWERFMDPHKEDPDYAQKYPWAQWGGFPGLDGSVYLADATGDGKDEIFLQLDDMPGMYALTGDGEVYGWAHWSDGNANPVATDYTGDGNIEVMFASDGGRIVMKDAASFNTMCTFDSRDHGPHPASISVAPTVADLTGDGRKEIVFGVRNAVEDEDDDEWYLKQNAHYFAVTADCGLLWHKTWEWGNPHVHMKPVPVEHNGTLALVFQDWNTVGHKPGDWEHTGASNLFAVEAATGELLWREEVGTYWSNKNIAMADMTGNGEPEILINDHLWGHDGVVIYDWSMQRKGFLGAGEGWVLSRGPVISDLTGDGAMEVILPVHRAAEGCPRKHLDVGCREGALRVYTTPSKTDPHSSNVHLYNHRYDVLGETPRLALPEARLEDVRVENGSFLLRMSSIHPILDVHIRHRDSPDWYRLHTQQDDVYISLKDPLPEEGERYYVRVTVEDGRQNHLTFTWRTTGWSFGSLDPHESDSRPEETNPSPIEGHVLIVLLVLTTTIVAWHRSPRRRGRTSPNRK